MSRNRSRNASRHAGPGCQHGAQHRNELFTCNLRAVRLRGDERGESFVEYLVLLGVIALGGLLAFRSLAAAVTETTDRAAEHVRSMTPMGTSGTGKRAYSLPPWVPSPTPDGMSHSPSPSPDVPIVQDDSVAVGLPNDASVDELQRIYANATPTQREELLANPAVQAKVDEYLKKRFPDVQHPSQELREAVLRGEDFTDKPGMMEKVIVGGDRAFGNGLIDSAFEVKLLTRWTEGDGSPYVLSNDELAMLQRSSEAKSVGTYIQGHQAELADGKPHKISDNGPTVQAVTLADGSRGYKADLDFNQPDDTGGGDPLDGSLGRAQGFFDERGDLVGVLDGYDFSNDNLAAHGVNAAGAWSLGGAHNYVVSGGMIEKNAKVTLMLVEDPGRVESVVEVAGDIVDGVCHKVSSWF